MLILLILLIYMFVKGAFEFERVTRTEMIILPLYSLIMMVITLSQERSWTTLGLAIILLLLGIMIGFFQATRVEIKDTGEVDEYQRPIIKAKRNWPFLVGWILVFVMSIAVELFLGTEMSGDDISHELFKELLRDMSSFVFLSTANTWIIWVLNVATSITYDGYLLMRYPKIRQAVRKKHSHK